MRIVSTMIAITLSMTFANSADAEALNEAAPIIRAVETNSQPASVIRVQSVNNPPHCDDWSIKLNAPSYATASGTVGFLHKCSDPDGDKLVYHWSVYSEASSPETTARIDAEEAPQSGVLVNGNSGAVIQIVLEVTDDGAPKLTSYRRLEIRIK